MGYVGRKTRKGPLARKPLASCPLGPPDRPSLSWPCCGPCRAAELLSARGVEHGPALHGGRQRGRTSAASRDLPAATRPPPPRARLGSHLGGLAPAAALGRQLARWPAPAAPPSPGPLGSASPAWPVPPRSPRSPGRGSFASLPAVAQGLAHGMGILCPPVKRRKPGALLWEDPGA